MKKRHNFCDNFETIDNLYSIEEFAQPNNKFIHIIDNKGVNLVYPDFHGSIPDINKYEIVPDNHILIFMTELNYSGLVDDGTHSNICEYLKNMKRDDIKKLLYTYSISDNNKLNKAYMGDNNIFMNCFKNSTCVFSSQKYIDLKLGVNRKAHMKYSKTFKKGDKLGGFKEKRHSYLKNSYLSEFLNDEKKKDDIFIYLFTLCRPFKIKENKPEIKTQIKTLLTHELLINYYNIYLLKTYKDKTEMEPFLLCSSIQNNKFFLVNSERTINPIINKNIKDKYLLSKHTDLLIYLYEKIVISNTKIEINDILIFFKLSLGKQIFLLNKLINSNINKKIIKSFVILIINFLLKKNNKHSSLLNYKYLIFPFIETSLDYEEIKMPNGDIVYDNIIKSMGDYYFHYKEELITFIGVCLDIVGNNIEFNKLIKEIKFITNKTASILGYVNYIYDKKYVYNNIIDLIIDDVFTNSNQITDFITDLCKYSFNNLKSIIIKSNKYGGVILNGNLNNFFKNIINIKSQNKINLKILNLMINEDGISIIITDKIKSCEINNIFGTSNINFIIKNFDSNISIIKSDFVELCINNNSTNYYDVIINNSNIETIHIQNEYNRLILEDSNIENINYVNTKNQILHLFGEDVTIPKLTDDIFFKEIALYDVLKSDESIQEVKCKRLLLGYYHIHLSDYPDNIICTELILNYNDKEYYNNESQKNKLTEYIHNLIKKNLKIINRKKTHYKINHFKKEFKINNRLQKKIRVI